jgi:AcrR family transcriptional regulator
MPKIVDYDQRRRDLVQATLRLIVRQGLDGATMRDIATEAGFANGVVKTYFGSKADLLAATYLYVFEATNARVGDLDRRACAGSTLCVPSHTRCSR